MTTATADNTARFQNYSLYLRSGSAATRADGAARPRGATIGKLDTFPPAVAVGERNGAGRGEAPEEADPRYRGRDPEDPRPGANAGAAAPPGAGAQFAGEDVDAPPADDAAARDVAHETDEDWTPRPVHVPKVLRL